nr:hypothetical protein B0A51_07295 [Rachicladosporium sp. CCFEE 5018]
MDFIKKTLAENLTGPAHNLATGSDAFDLNTDVPDLSGRVALVTGGSEGIGFGCTHTLLTRNISKLFVLSVRAEKLDEALDAVEAELGKKARDAIVWKQCDLSDWEKTANVANEIAKETDRLDIVINVAARGIMTRQLAETNGTDLHMAANHIGHVVLTSHLLPLLKKTAKAGNIVRIVNFASNLHEQTPKETQFASVEELNRDYGPQQQYARSKLATLLYSKYLSRHLTPENPGILANAVHPGIVDTAQTNDHIHEAYPLLGYGMSVGMKAFRKDQFEGCVSAMYAATVAEKSGLYICPPKIIEQGSDKANDVELAERLMKLTKEVVDEKTGASKKGCPLKMY